MMGEPTAAPTGDILIDTFGKEIASKLDLMVIGTDCTILQVVGAIVKSSASVELAGAGGRWKTVADEIGVSAATCKAIKNGILVGTIECLEDVLKQVLLSAITQFSDTSTVGRLCRVFMRNNMLDFANQLKKEFCFAEINKANLKKEKA